MFPFSYIVIRYPIKGKLYCTRSRAMRVIFTVSLLCLLITLPTWFEWTIVFVDTQSMITSTTPTSIQESSIKRNIIARVVNSDLGNSLVYRVVYYWLSVFAFVFIPLTILTLFNLFLVRSVRRSSQKRREWIRQESMANAIRNSISTMKVPYSSEPASSTNQVPSKSFKILGRFEESRPRESLKQPPDTHIFRKLFCITLNRLRRRCNSIQHEETTSWSSINTNHRSTLLRQDSHITRLLIVVVIFFLVCQLPPASVIIYRACTHESSPDSAQELILRILGNIFNLMVAINAAGNFILYYLLSQKYRSTLRQLTRSLRRKLSCCSCLANHCDDKQIDVHEKVEAIHVEITES